jgi:hypothetical protein
MSPAIHTTDERYGLHGGHCSLWGLPWARTKHRGVHLREGAGAEGLGARAAAQARASGRNRPLHNALLGIASQCSPVEQSHQSAHSSSPNGLYPHRQGTTSALFIVTFPSCLLLTVFSPSSALWGRRLPYDREGGAAAPAAATERRSAAGPTVRRSHCRASGSHRWPEGFSRHSLRVTTANSSVAFTSEGAAVTIQEGVSMESESNVFFHIDFGKWLLKITF